MDSKIIEMQSIFSKLNENNKDVILLLAKNMKVAQDSMELPLKPPPVNCST